MNSINSESRSQGPSRGAAQDATSLALPVRRTFHQCWPEYFKEGAELGLFMISACLFASLYEYPASPVRASIPSALLRRILMGVSMGATAIAIIYSRWGKQSGAHMNPALTLSFLSLGKISRRDAFFYVLAQFVGGIVGAEVAGLLLGKIVSGPPVSYATTVPGGAGIWAAFAAEYLMAFGMMALVLYTTNNLKLSRYTGILAGVTVAIYITVAAPTSGMSINPARTIASALPAKEWTAVWIYLIAPPLGMLSAARLFVWWKGASSVKCCKLQHESGDPCVFCGATA